MLQQTSRGVARAAVAGFVLVACGLVMADDKQQTKGGRKSSDAGKTSGVIAKIEPTERGDENSKRSWIVTLNTDIVWRDFVRDQATDPARAARTDTGQAARKGREA